MPVTEIDLEKAALLHDIGKLYQRAGKIRKSHSLVGQKLLSHFFDADHQAILRAVAHHHQNELQAVHLPDDDISYIVYEADNLAAASDRARFDSRRRTGRERDAFCIGFAVEQYL